MEVAGTFASGSALTALAAFLVAMLLVGLLSAFSRVKGLHRNGLIDDESLGRTLCASLHSSRRFIVPLGALYLAATAVGAFALGRLAVAAWPDSTGWRLHVPVAVAVVASWSIGGAIVKAAATRAALGYARWMVGLLQPAIWLLRPWSSLMSLFERDDDTLWATDAIPYLSTGEIRSLLSDEGEGVGLEDAEREMIHSILGFHEMIVREGMVPRIDMVALEVGAPVEEAVGTVVECNHSRIPLYEGGVDKITGLLYAKDLLALVRDGRLRAEGKTVGDLSRPAYFIPESKKLDETMSELKAKRIHMAIVIDEYGGTAGLVTLEDVIEEIVGEIEDEFDEAERLFEWIDDRTLRIDPKINLEDLQDVAGIELPIDEGSETLAGLVYEAAGKVPEQGDEVTIAGLKVVVEGVADQRILQVRMVAPEALPGYAAGGGGE